ncbi:MAG: chemotaxis protein CheX [Planctomycetaceae bacterium]|jgi:chemotaxis protein CheX|nr:chemotaxis protein CheX [Planctomycetaceae bacterium]
MDASSIAAFVVSTNEVFRTMLSLSVTAGKPYSCCTVPKFENEVSGIIGMSGDVQGMVVLSFPTATACNVIRSFTGMDMDPSSPDFADAIGELVNMISGAAKAKFEGKNVSISCPSVVVGKGHKVQQPSDALCITIPFECAGGAFSVEVAMKVARAAAHPTQNTTAAKAA